MQLVHFVKNINQQFKLRHLACDHLQLASAIKMDRAIVRRRNHSHICLFQTDYLE